MQTPKIIILEGPDGAGKTTLANNLIELLKKRDPEAAAPTIRHEGVPPQERDPYSYYADRLVDASRECGVVILDRFHIGQYVYAPMWRNDFRFTRKDLLEFSRLLKTMDAQAYLVLPPIAECLKNYRVKLAKKDDYLNDQSAWYESYYRFKGLGGIFPEFDYTQHLPEQLLDGELI